MSESESAALAIKQVFEQELEATYIEWCRDSGDDKPWFHGTSVAAALRELADHAAPMPVPVLASEQTQANAVAQEVQMEIRQKIIAIAIALEGPRVQSAKWQPLPEEAP